MKRPLQAKEVAYILLPTVGLVAFAFYQYRLEKNKDVRRADGVYVKGVQVKRAKGRLQAQGLSHEVEVKIDYERPTFSWPTNKGVWDLWKNTASVDPLNEPALHRLRAQSKMDETVAYGAVLTTTSMENGKPVIKTQWHSQGTTPIRRGNQITFSHPVALDKIPLSAGEVTFRGLYVLLDREPLRVTRGVRKAGEKPPSPEPHNQNGRVVSLEPAESEFYKISITPSVKPLDAIEVVMVLASKSKTAPLIYDMELHDGQGQLLRPSAVGGFDATCQSRSDGQGGVNNNEQIISLHLAPTLQTANPLVLKGKVSIDDGWPIPFSVQLPKR